LTTTAGSCHSRCVKSCGPSGSQDLAFEEGPPSSPPLPLARRARAGLANRAQSRDRPGSWRRPAPFLLEPHRQLLPITYRSSFARALVPKTCPHRQGATAGSPETRRFPAVS
jgi:hypothetical protein